MSIELFVEKIINSKFIKEFFIYSKKFQNNNYFFYERMLYKKFHKFKGKFINILINNICLVKQ